MMEVCVDSIQSAVQAQQGGACRLELCSSLALGGLTPSNGLVKVVKETVDIPVYVLIRPREGDFLYTELEKRVILDDVTAVVEAGADGIVIGALTSDGQVDMELCHKIKDICDGKPITFHRAFDVTCDPNKSLETIIELGITRLLTSGQSKTAFDGIELLTKLHHQANGRINIMPGGGITEDNVAEILKKTGVKEFHTSARTTTSSSMLYKNSQATMGNDSDDYRWKVCCSDKVRAMLDIAQNVWSN